MINSGFLWMYKYRILYLEKAESIIQNAAVLLYTSTIHRGWAHSLLHERLDEALEVLSVDVFAERVLERVDGLVQFLLVCRFLKLKNKKRPSDPSVPTTLR